MRVLQTGGQSHPLSDSGGARPQSHDDRAARALIAVQTACRGLPLLRAACVLPIHRCR